MPLTNLNLSKLWLLWLKKDLLQYLYKTVSTKLFVEQEAKIERYFTNLNQEIPFE